MKRTELITFLILAFNFIVTGMIAERPSFLSNDIIFTAAAIGAAYVLTKYVFYISKIMSKKGNDRK